MKTLHQLVVLALLGSGVMGWPTNIAAGIQEAASQLHLTEVMSLDGSRQGVHFARIGSVRVAPDGDFFVFDPGVQSLYLFAADGESAREIGKRGEGPGNFVRGITTLISDGRFTIFDLGQGLLHTFSVDGEFVDARRAPTVEGATLTVAQELREGHWVGVSQPSWRFRLSDGKIDTPGHVFAMPAGADVQVLLEYVTAGGVFFDKTYEVPHGGVHLGVSHTGDWDLVGDSAVVVLDGTSGVVEWYRVDMEGYELLYRIDTEIPAQPLSAEDRRQLIARQTESHGRLVTQNTGWLFPERVPGLSRIIADSQGLLWLQRSSIHDRGSAIWRVVDADSGACRSVMPFHADHRFRCMPISDSGACRSPWSERVGALENLL